MVVMGTFLYEEDFLAAAERVKAANIGRLSLMSPLPLHEAQEVLELGKSPVRRFSLAGAIIGACFGFGLAVWTALVFILPTGGRAVIALPPYLVITYEMTILLGVLFTLVGFHFVSGLPAWHDAPYLPEANVDRFVIAVEGADESGMSQVESIFRDVGAETTQRIEDPR